LDVIRVAAPEVNILTSDDRENVQILDPKSKYVSDEEFAQSIEIIADELGTEPEIRKVGFNTNVSFKLPMVDTDNFLGDLFSKGVTLTRLAQGGLNLQTDLLRLVCSNGMTLADPQFRCLLRNGIMSKPISTAFIDSASNFNVDTYFKSIFSKNGTYIDASVADYLGMKDTLSKISSEEVGDILYPIEAIENFYAAQDIEIGKLSRKNLEKLPSGLKYYECFNILTNGAKQAERTLDNEMAVADWFKPSRMSQLKQSNLRFEGIPEFSRDVIKMRMGDI
jgi:hypothetical protein